MLMKSHSTPSSIWLSSTLTFWRTLQIEELQSPDIELMEAIGRKRGALRAGGHIDIHKCSWNQLLHELRSGTLGEIALFSEWLLKS